MSPRTPGLVRADRQLSATARRALVALGAAALTVGAAASGLPILHSAAGQDSAVAGAALGSDPAGSTTFGFTRTVPAAPHSAIRAAVPATTPVHRTIRRAALVHQLAKPTGPNKDKGKTKTKTKTAAKTTGGKKISVELTGYSWFDNTPPGSSEVANPIVHQKAGGVGSYADPITVAVANGSFKAGTRFYVASLKRYLIVEDSGASSGKNHLDVWIGGKGGSKSGVSKCMDRFTGKSTAEQNPPAGRPVLSGPIYGAGGCRLPS